jgi:hypothetical protein
MVVRNVWMPPTFRALNKIFKNKRVRQIDELFYLFYKNMKEEKACSEVFSKSLARR